MTDTSDTIMDCNADSGDRLIELMTLRGTACRAQNR
jgi:hypothetical protein